MEKYDWEISHLFSASASLFALAEDWSDDLQDRFREFGGWELPSIDESASALRAFANFLRGWQIAANQNPKALFSVDLQAELDAI
jgi:hypothetical protein